MKRELKKKNSLRFLASFYLNIVICINKFPSVLMRKYAAQSFESLKLRVLAELGELLCTGIKFGAFLLDPHFS